MAPELIKDGSPKRAGAFPCICWLEKVRGIFIVFPVLRLTPQAFPGTVTLIRPDGSSFYTGYSGVADTKLITPEIPRSEDTVNKLFKPCFTMDVY